MTCVYTCVSVCKRPRRRKKRKRKKNGVGKNKRLFFIRVPSIAAQGTDRDPNGTLIFAFGLHFRHAIPHDPVGEINLTQAAVREPLREDVVGEAQFGFELVRFRYGREGFADDFS